jgi:hypothetical protein
VETVTLSFFRFDLAAGDYVTIYDGPTTSSTVLATYTGSTIPAAVTSTGPQMLVTLTSDGSVTGNGFQADYETSLIPYCTGSTTLTGDAADFGDGSGRFQYRNSGTCKWYIKPENAETTTLTFNSFNTEDGEDVVSVYDLVAGVLLGSYTGNYTTPPAPITSSSGQMLVIFNANSTVRGEGWDASYTITVGTPEISGIESVHIYPNPTSGLVNLSFNAAGTQSVNLEVLSVTGNPVFSETLGTIQGNFSKQIDLSGLAKGVYILRLTSGNGVKMSKIVLR